MKNFKISKPIYTYTEIEGGLGPGSIPLIKINYKTENNDIFINDSMHIKNVSFSGDFVNTLNKHMPMVKGQEKGFQINVDSLIAEFNNSSINIEHIRVLQNFNSKYQTKNTSWFPDMDSHIIIEKGHFMMLDTLRNKRISGYINELNTKLNFNKNTIYASAQMNIQMKEMGLNLANGTFFNDAHLVGNMTSTFNKISKQIEVPFFKLKIDRQEFNVKADINTI